MTIVAVGAFVGAALAILRRLRDSYARNHHADNVVQLVERREEEYGIIDRK